MTEIISSTLDQQIRNSKSTNTAKAQKLKNAMDELHDLIDPEKAKLSINDLYEY